MASLTSPAPYTTRRTKTSCGKTVPSPCRFLFVAKLARRSGRLVLDVGRRFNICVNFREKVYLQEVTNRQIVRHC